MQPNRIIRAFEVGDLTALSSFEEFIGDCRVDMRRGNLMGAALNGTGIGCAKIAPGEFLGWPLLSVVCLSTAFRGRGELIIGAINNAQWLRFFSTPEALNEVMRSFSEALCMRHRIFRSLHCSVRSARIPQAHPGPCRTSLCLPSPLLGRSWGRGASPARFARMVNTRKPVRAEKQKETPKSSIQLQPCPKSIPLTLRSQPLDALASPDARAPKNARSCSANPTLTRPWPPRQIPG